MARSVGLFVAGLLAGWLLFGVFGSNESRTSRTARQVATTDDAGDASQRSGAADPGSPNETDAERVEPRVGTGVIRGRVLDPSGRPVEGVPIEAVSERAEERRTARARPSDAVARARATLDAVLRYRASVRTVRSDGEGRFTFDKLPDDWHMVTMVDRDRVAGIPLRRVRPGADLVFRVREARQVKVEVVGPEGVLLPHVRVNVLGGGAYPVSWSRIWPFLKLPPGGYEIQATGGSNLEYRSEVRTIEVPASGRLDPVSLRLVAKPRLEIRATAPGVMRLFGVKIWCVAPRQKPVSFQDLQSLPEAGLVGEGRYVARIREPGEYEVVAFLGARELGRRTVAYRGEAQAVDLPLTIPDTVVRVRATDELGQRIPVRSVALVPRQRGGSASLGVAENGDWLFLLDGVTADVAFRVMATNWGEVDVPGPHGAEVVAVLQEPCHLVVEPPRHPAFQPDWAVHVGWQYAMFHAGRVRQVVQPGRKTLRLVANGKTIARTELVLESGPRVVPAPEPDLVRLRVQGDARRHIRIHKSTAPPFLASKRADVEGWVDFGWVPRGRYTIKRKGVADVDVDVTSDTEIAR